MSNGNVRIGEIWATVAVIAASVRAALACRSHARGDDDRSIRQRPHHREKQLDSGSQRPVLSQSAWRFIPIPAIGRTFCSAAEAHSLRRLQQTTDVVPMIPLILKALHLHDGPMKDVGRRFKKSFDRVWRKRGPHAKETITTYFRQHPGTVYLCFRMDFDNQEPYGRCSYHYSAE